MDADNGNMTRRQLLQAGALLAPAAAAGPEPIGIDWIRTCRGVILEAYNYPMYPAYSYSPEEAVEIAKSLGANAFRYPAASYYAYYPTKTRYPIHPGVGSSDPMARTIELLHKAGLKAIAYLPLNHQFMETDVKNPDFDGWKKRTATGGPMIGSHLGYNTYFQGCFNSPLRQVILAMVREVIAGYPADAIYFDGPYQGVQSAGSVCWCRYCREAWRKASGRDLPSGQSTADELRAWRLWMRDVCAEGLMREARSVIRSVRDVPVLYNNTVALSPLDGRSHLYKVTDGFMFEAARTPEEKLFNLKVGQSTGKVVWTYVGHHSLHERQRLTDSSKRAWMSYPIEGQELLLDGAVAFAAGAGTVYWSVSRFFGQPKAPLAYESGRYVKALHEFAAKHERLCRELHSKPAIGILTSTQTHGYYRGPFDWEKEYGNCYHGAFQIFKSLRFDAEPFLDHSFDQKTLSRYKLVYAPNAVCLSKAQCDAITEYVRGGGVLCATHMTSMADETGRPREDFGLAELFGVHARAPDPVEISDLYLRPPGGGELTPQDPQVMLLRPEAGTTVLAETFERARNRVVGPSLFRRDFGKGSVIYIGSSLEAAYFERRAHILRDYLGKLLAPVLDGLRTYRVDDRAGLIPQLMASDRHLLLHLLANTGDKQGRTMVEEQFLPLEDVAVELRIPAARQVRRVSLLRSPMPVKWVHKDGWVRLKVPRVLIHEAVWVELS